MVIEVMKLEYTCFLRESYDKPRQHIEKQRHHFAEKVCIVKDMVFPVVMYGYESWIIKKLEHRRIDAFDVLEKTLESPLDCKGVKPVNPKGNQSWQFIERTDAEAEAPILWPAVQRADSLEKTLLIGKDPDAGKDWRREKKGTAEGKMVR